MLTATLLLFAQQAVPPSGGPASAADPSRAPRAAEQAPQQRVSWYTSWDQALAEAQRLNRPILLQSAAPQCSGVPGMW